MTLSPQIRYIVSAITFTYRLFTVCLNIGLNANSYSGGADQRKSGGERRDPSTAAEVDLQRKTDVRFSLFFIRSPSLIRQGREIIWKETECMIMC